MRALRDCLFAATLCAALPAASIAQAQPAAAATARPLMRINPPADVSITVFGLSALAAVEVAKAGIAPGNCRLCKPPRVDTYMRDLLRWNSGRWPNILSYVTGFVLTPVAALGLDAWAIADARGTFDEWMTDAMILGESLAIASDVNQIVKIIAARERPYVQSLDPALRALVDPDRNLSFYSGHTGGAFAMAVSAGTMATMKGYDSAPAIWVAGLTCAWATGYLRIAADRHYLLDVLVAAAAGSAVGFLIPYLHRPLPAPVPGTSGPAPQPASAPMISYRGEW